MYSPVRAFACALSMLVFSSASIAQPPIAISPSEGVLVLRNGHILSGRITPQGDHYLVSISDSSEVRMPAAQVELVCRDLEEAYVVKRDRLARGNIDGHLRLADWCLRHQLYARAADQILCCLALNPDHPRISALDRRLTGTTSVPPVNTVAANEVSANRQDPLDEFMAELPPGAVKHFTEKVQPVLLNGCATNACHGSASKSKLRLIRPRRGRVLANRMTQRNLQSALRFVDVRDPASSPLLTAPSTPHGGTETPIFGGPGDEPREAVLKWIREVAARPLAPPQTSTSRELAAEPNKPGESRRRVRTSASSEPSRSAPPAGDRSAPLAEVEGQDPFDPEIFNRRFATARRRRE